MITREDCIKEIERELRMREQVYPNLIARGKLNRTQAERQYRRLRAALTYLGVEEEKKHASQIQIQF